MTQVAQVGVEYAAQVREVASVREAIGLASLFQLGHFGVEALHGAFTGIDAEGQDYGAQEFDAILGLYDPRLLHF